MVKMAEDDIYAQQKMEILSTQQVQKNFRVQVNFEERIMSRFISFLRFVEFDENIAHLYTLKGQWEQRTRPQPEDSDDYDPPNFYTAEDVPVISKQNERKVWLRIK